MIMKVLCYVTSFRIEKVSALRRDGGSNEGGMSGAETRDRIG